jgi:hypothetical protein
MKLEFSGHMFDKYSNVKHHVNPTGGGGIVRSGLTEGQTRPRQLCLFASSRECLKINVRFVLYTEIYVCVCTYVIICVWVYKCMYLCIIYVVIYVCIYVCGFICM